MTRPLRPLLAIILAAGGLALAAPFAQASPEVSRVALHEVDSARDALHKGQMNAAVEHTERAQTTLLNAKQAGDDTAPHALGALDNAHKGLLDHDRKGAMAALDEAANDLRGATS